MKYLFIGAIFLCGLFTYADESQSAASSSSVEAKEVSVPHQIYETSTSGFRDYLETVRESNSKLYAELDPRLEKLERGRAIALYGGGSLFLAGAAVALVGVFDRGKVDGNLDSPTFGQQIEEDGNGKILAGAGVMLVGLGVFLYFNPSRKDYFNFINHHNRLNPGAPLRFGLKFDEKAPKLAFAYSF